MAKINIKLDPNFRQEGIHFGHFRSKLKFFTQYLNITWISKELPNMMSLGGLVTILLQFYYISEVFLYVNGYFPHPVNAM